MAASGGKDTPNLAETGLSEQKGRKMREGAMGGRGDQDGEQLLGIIRVRFGLNSQDQTY